MVANGTKTKKLYANKQISKLRMVNPNANELTVVDIYL